MIAQAADETLADFQAHLNLIFARARTLWKESAARIHPDLQPAGYKLLAYIARTGDASAHRLAELFEMDKSVVSRQLRMLEDFGLIESRPDERDGRQRVLTARPEAAQALAQLRSETAERMRSVLAELTSDEVQAASKVFRLLSEV
ncbi:MarR family transcriptional regulator [Microbacterium sp. ARD32]|uniref:MarR family winged helix-turn-helix transcriptional regulator n=1 Tax=Microbacterium sp. ARD32 TaxID=2962577 RepID=UPI002882318E|nr:MarR family transcriptional regulator [Microbacterium sp. ARD32]MDT0158226.1 MarR family transcriptional regulator [Microbacterium sp. ARD32]